MPVPPLQLDAAPNAPADIYGGLLGAATVLPLQARGEAGVQYPPDSCDPAQVTAAPCIGGDDPTDPFPEILADPGPGDPQIVSLPFNVWGAAQCAAVGGSWDSQVARARRNLEQGEGRAVEDQLWSAGLGYAANLSGAAVPVILPAAADLTEAVGVAEEYLGQHYGFTGMLHAGKRVAAYAGLLASPDRSRPLLRAPAGSVWVFGGGYYPHDAPPAGAAGPAADAWLYATGWITAYRSDIWTLPPDQGAGFDRASNIQTAFAGRTYVLTWQCVTAAVPITAL